MPWVSSAPSASEPSPTAGNTRSARAGRCSQGRRMRASATTMAPAARASTIERDESFTGRSQMVHTITRVHAPLRATARCAPRLASCPLFSMRRAKFIKEVHRQRSGSD
jgi:hypothetical protein